MFYDFTDNDYNCWRVGGEREGEKQPISEKSSRELTTIGRWSESSFEDRTSNGWPMRAQLHTYVKKQTQITKESSTIYSDLSSLLIRLDA